MVVCSYLSCELKTCLNLYYHDQFVNWYRKEKEMVSALNFFYVISPPSLVLYILEKINVELFHIFRSEVTILQLLDRGREGNNFIVYTLTIFQRSSRFRVWYLFSANTLNSSWISAITAVLFEIFISLSFVLSFSSSRMYSILRYRVHI